ncbi:MAG: endolytic transglycosylase MltG [Acidimicrobiales bacterium]
MPEQPDPFELFGLEPSTPATEGGPPSAPAGRSPVANSAKPTFNAETARSPLQVSGGDDDYVTLKGGGSGGRFTRWALLLGLGIVLVAFVVGAAGFWVKGKIDPGNPGEEVAFTVTKGATTSQIAVSLAQKNIVSSSTVFEWYVKWKGGDPFQAGDYEGLRVNSAMGDVIDVLKAGPPPPKTVSFLVREGLWLSEFRELTLEKFPTMDPAALDAALANTHPSLQPAGSTNIEGFLYPATYEIAQQDVGNAQKLIDQMVAAFGRVSQAEDLAQAPVKLKGVAGTKTITPYEALIVASLIESEAKIDEDRAKIARVIYNRLAIGDMLGIDASVLYALQQRKTNITNSDLRTDSPYNTRLKRGLPPTPINSPGQKSINAALNPAPGDWLFYVLTNKDGTHYFANNLTDFNRAVADAKARGVF